MSTVWIVTTGNSDVQLTSIPEQWDSLCKEKKANLKPCFDDFRGKEGISKLKTDLYTVVARLLGVVFSNKIDNYWDYFKFPLLDGFYNKFDELKVKPDRIIILLTNQETIFDDDKRSNPDSPYWKDTCALEPIFERYFKDKFKDKYDVKIDSIFLQPEKDQDGLDDWNATLLLVQNKFTGLGIDRNDDVIVSHQAGTPAISSAVQFASLSQFGGKVSFLTSNERTEVASLNLSSYFESMQIQEAQKFLENHDYVSVFSVLEEKLERLKEQNPDQADKIIKLLAVSKLWNLSKFDEFKEVIENLPIQSLRDVATARFGDSWAWWIAYEEAYLGVVRRTQGNIVEAFFHSFRAFEGILAMWGNHEFANHIEVRKNRHYLKPSILEDPEDYFSKAESDDFPKLKKKIEDSKDVGIELDFADLCKLFRLCRSQYKSKCKKLGVVIHTNGVSANRNAVFHQVQGISEDLLLSYWQIDSSKDIEVQIKEWEEKILHFLNFIADEKGFKNWEDASLMARVHKELMKEIGAIANKSNI